MPRKDLQLPHRRPFSQPSKTHPRAFVAPRKNNYCHCFHSIPYIYPLYHFQQYCSTLVLMVSASLSLTILLEQPLYYEKILTLPLYLQYWAEMPSDPSQSLGSARSASGSFPAKKKVLPLTPPPKSRKQHTKPSHLTGSRHMGDRPSSPIYPTAEQELHLG